MKRNIITMATIAAISLSSCSSKTADSQQANDAPAEKTLVLYYSQTGTTKAVAEELQRQLGADIACIEAVDPYPADYDATIARWRQELADSVKPAIKPLDVNLDDYSTIFLGFPVWGGTYALPVATFVENNPLKGKKVVTFATFGSGGIDSATEDLVKALPDATVLRGYGVRTARLDKAKDEISRFLIENGYIEGEVEPLPEYSAQVPVTDEDVKIFKQACDGYKFPLGTPLTVGKRQTPNSVDYKFVSDMQMPDGKKVQRNIYVTVEANADPVFTLVQ